MREVSKKFAAYPLQPLKLSDVEKDADDQIAAQRRHIQLIAARFNLSRLNMRFDRLVTVERLTECIINRRVAGCVNQTKRRRIGRQGARRARQRILRIERENGARS